MFAHLKHAGLVVILASRLTVSSFGQPPVDPRAFLRTTAGFDDRDLKRIDRGAAVARLLPTNSPEELFVLGAVHIQAAPSGFAKFAMNIDRLRKSAQYLDVQRIQEPPRLEDFARFSLTEEDLRELRRCKSGNCIFQIPSESVAEFERSFDWSSPNVLLNASNKLQQMARAAVQRYQEVGNQALGTYRDKNNPVHVASQLATLVAAIKGLPYYPPELNRHLLEYPAFRLPGAQTLFYWEKVNFGLKPTLRINHMTAHRTNGAEIVAIKQLYANHYLQVALDISICIPEPRGGFYLLNWRGSRQDGLTGFRGSILRRIISSRIQSSQVAILESAKHQLETR